MQASPEMEGVRHPLARDESVSARVSNQFDVDLRASLDCRRQRREVMCQQAITAQGSTRVSNRTSAAMRSTTASTPSPV